MVRVPRLLLLFSRNFNADAIRTRVSAMETDFDATAFKQGKKNTVAAVAWTRILQPLHSRWPCVDNNNLLTTTAMCNRLSRKQPQHEAKPCLVKDKRVTACMRVRLFIDARANLLSTAASQRAVRISPPPPPPNINGSNGFNSRLTARTITKVTATTHTHTHVGHAPAGCLLGPTG